MAVYGGTSASMEAECAAQAAQHAASSSFLSKGTRKSSPSLDVDNVADAARSAGEAFTSSVAAAAAAEASFRTTTAYITHLIDAKGPLSSFADDVADAADTDLSRLHALDLGLPRKLGKPIDLSESGPLGPLWPHGAPRWATKPTARPHPRSVVRCESALYGLHRPR